MGVIEAHIDQGKPVVITFKDNNGQYHNKLRTFDTYEDYESYCDTRMRQSGWKEIGTDIHTPKKNSDGES